MKRIVFLFVTGFLLLSSAQSVFAVNPGNILSGFNEAEMMRDGSTINFGLFTTASAYNVKVYDTYLSGYAWGEKIGWISLNCANEVVNNCASNGNFHVVNNTSGQLSGWAWGQKTGWINFGPFVNNGAQTVVINPSTGEFNGYAWAQKIGWIKFECPGSACVKTDWVPTPVVPPVSTGGGGGVPVCSDPTALNYNTIGLCTYPIVISGCTNQSAINYNSNATIDDGSCTFVNQISGCTNSGATNYNPSATVNNGSCLFAMVSGCTNPLATNYNPNATSNNGICTFSQQPPSCATNSSLCVPPPTPTTCTTNPALCANPQQPISNSPQSGVAGSTPNSSSPVSNQSISSLLSVPAAGQYLGGLVHNVFNSFANLNLLQGISFSKWFGVLGILSALLSIPIQFWRSLFAFLYYNKRRPWGIVYDSVTKQPLDPAYVVLKDLSGVEVTMATTDLDGRYGFLEKQGTYTIVANKTHYQFPSTKLAGKSRDELYDDLYFGDQFSIERDGDVVTKNIPMDPLDFDWNEFAKRQQKLMKYYRRRDVWLSRISTVVFYIGFSFSVLALIADVSPLNIGIVLLYIVLYILRNTVFKHKAFGVVIEKATGLPIPFALIHVKFASIGNEVAKTVTTATGKYYKLIANGIYIVSIEKKQDDGTYVEIWKSDPMEITNGVLNQTFLV